MKFLVAALVVISCCTAAVAQESTSGFGFYEAPRDQPCLTKEQRQEISQQIAENLMQLEVQGRLPAKSQQRVLLDWPLRAAVWSSDYGYHGISNFVDQNPAFPGQLLDYNCGSRTYDLASGYNHQGIDYFLWPFDWTKMNDDAVQIVAAAPGIIILKDDGSFDRNCGFNNQSWNAVYVRHDDGSVAWYGHMKSNSLTPKTPGSRVETGEFLGTVGSSGSSTGPHLHFELYDDNGQLVEPYQGACNQMNAESWWLSQRPYYDSAVNALRTHFAPPQFLACPNPAIINATTRFDPGQTAYFVAYYRDQLISQTSQYRILQPDGSVFRQWSHNSNAGHYNASYWYWSWPLPANAPAGTWIFQVSFEGKTYEHRFTVGLVPPALTAVPDHSVFEDIAYRFALAALGNPPPRFALVAAPPGVAIDSTSGEISWVPDDEHVGEHRISIRANNTQGSDSTSYLLTVVPVNDPPSAFSLLTPADGDTLVALNEPVQFTWQPAYDPDSDTLAYTLRFRGGQGADTTITRINETTVTLDGSSLFRPGQTYVWQVVASDGEFNISAIRPHRLVTSPVTEVTERSSELPQAFRLLQNYPNPFAVSSSGGRVATSVRYEIPFSGGHAVPVNLSIYDLRGRLVRTLIDTQQGPGRYAVPWDGCDSQGQHVPAGTYFYRLKAGDHVSTKKALLLQ